MATAADFTNPTTEGEREGGPLTRLLHGYFEGLINLLPYDNALRLRFGGVQQLVWTHTSLLAPTVIFKVLTRRWRLPRS